MVLMICVVIPLVGGSIPPYIGGSEAVLGAGILGGNYKVVSLGGHGSGPLWAWALVGGLLSRPCLHFFMFSYLFHPINWVFIFNSSTIF